MPNKQPNSPTKYEDGPNKDKILHAIHNAPNIIDVMDIIGKHYPDWIVTFMHSYCEDYPQLQENWEKMCIHMEVKPTQIMIVEYIDFSDKQIIRTLSELFTRAGFSVKHVLEFIPCSKCDKAVPTEYLHNKFTQDKSKVIPRKYSSTCSKC